MPKVTGPLHSLTALGTIAGAIINTVRRTGSGSRAEITRASGRLHFRAQRTAPAPSADQTAYRDRLTLQTAYAKAPPGGDLEAIDLIMRARALPLYHAAAAYYAAQNPIEPPPPPEYSPPAFDAVDFDFVTTGYAAPSFDAVDFDF
jgi:hypothetical protein